MTEIFAKIKSHSKKVVLFAGLFSTVFVIVFYLVNLDLKSVKEKASSTIDPTPIVDTSAEIKKRLGSTTFSVEGYDEWAQRFVLDKKNNGIDQDPDKDGLPNYLEYVHGTDPLKTDTDGDKFTDKQEINNGYDPDAPGEATPTVEVKIAKIGVEAPMVWSKSEKEKDMLKDLEKGLSHYAKTASPGQNGNAIVSGHSSNYVWAKGDYNHIFKDLENMEAGDMILVKTTQKNGRVITYKYKVSEKFITVPDDDRIFAQTTSPTLTLSTCWPVGTTLKRTIVKADLLK